MPSKIKIVNNKFNINQGGLEPDYEFYDYGEIGGISSNARASGDELIPIGSSLEVFTRTGRSLVTSGSSITISTRSGDITVTVSTSSPPPDRFRSARANSIKADTDALTIDGGNDNVRYISNITNMRNNLKQVGATEKAFLPLWMRTAQAGSIAPPINANTISVLGKPCRSAEILLRIKNKKFDFKQSQL